MIGNASLTHLEYDSFFRFFLDQFINEEKNLKNTNFLAIISK